MTVPAPLMLTTAKPLSSRKLYTAVVPPVVLTPSWEMLLLALARLNVAAPEPSRSRRGVMIAPDCVTVAPAITRLTDPLAVIPATS